MLDKTQIQARELIISLLEKEMEKLEKKATKEKAKRDSASVTYQGVKYCSDSDLQEAYACDVFTSSVYDRLLDRLEKARGNVESYEMTPTQQLVLELQMITSNFKTELLFDQKERAKKEAQDKRAEELSGQGYSYREIETILGNEELMRYE